MKSGKHILYIFILALTPFVFIGLVELLLISINYGVDLNTTFFKTQDQQFYYLNKDITKRYFISSQATTGCCDFFKVKKDDTIFRIAVLGESSSLGFPYPASCSFARMLKYVLKNNMPDKKEIEVINLSFSAVNSYTFLDLAQELSLYKPDAVLLYGGHNEYYGALGVASAESLIQDPKLIKYLIHLKKLRIVQWFATLKESNKINANSLMQSVVDKMEIQYGSELYSKGIEQFDRNLRSMAQYFQKHGIDFYVSSIVSNIKDQRPFISDTTNHDALAAFEQGDKYYKEQRYNEASNCYMRAKEYDLLRFRAPEALNVKIKEVCRDYPNVFFVDTQKLFYLNSENGLYGFNLFTEHLHPNIKGHKLIAKAFFEKLAQRCHFDTNTFDNQIANFPILDFDTLVGKIVVDKLRGSFPFFEKTPKWEAQSFQEQVAIQYAQGQNWHVSMEQLYQKAISEKNFLQALRINEVLYLDNMHNGELLEQRASLAVLAKNYSLAYQTYIELYTKKPTIDNIKGVIINGLRCDKPEEVICCFSEIKRQYPNSYEGYESMKIMCEQLISLKKECYKNRNEIIALYTQMGNEPAVNIYKQKQVCTF